jgi:hypothetical protein
VLRLLLGLALFLLGLALLLLFRGVVIVLMLEKLTRHIFGVRK